MCLPYTICAGLPYYPRCCYFGRVSGFIRAFIPAIYLHLGPIAGLPVALTIDGAGLMMTENRTLFLLPKVWPLFNLPVPGVLLRGRSAFRALSLRGNIPGPCSGSVGKNGPFLITCTLGIFQVDSVFLGGRCVVGPSPLPSPSLHHPFTGQKFSQ